MMTLQEQIHFPTTVVLKYKLAYSYLKGCDIFDRKQWNLFRTALKKTLDFTGV